jgi:hypothetical protein
MQPALGIRLARGGAFALLFLVACPRQAPVADGGGNSKPAAPAALPPLELRLTGAPEQSWEVPLRTGELPTVAPSRTLQVRSNLPLRNYRLRILDESDRVLESDDREVSSGAKGLLYAIALEAPLQPGHRYTVLLDAQGPGPIEDSSGRSWAESRFTLQTAGTRERPSQRRRHR